MSEQSSPVSPAPARRNRRRGWPWLRLALLAVTLLLSLSGAIYLVGTESGRVALTNGGIAIARHFLPDLAIQAEGISSPQLGRWYFELLQVRYKDRPLVEGRKLTLHLDMQRLRHKQIHIPELSAQTFLFDNTLLVEYLEAHVSEVETSASTKDAAAPVIPAIWLERLAVQQLTIIDKGLKDFPVVAVNGEGSYHWPGRASALALEIAELPESKSGTEAGHQMHLELAGQMQSDTVYALTLSASEAAGGFLSHILQLP